MASITLAQARDVLDAGLRKADEIEVAMNIAVVDAGNNLTAFVRQDGAWLGAMDIAQSKAYTARAFDMPTEDLYEMSQPGGSLYGITASNYGQVIVFAGGVPLHAGGEVAGAVGVSGGEVDQDQQVAEAAAAAFNG